MPVGGLVERRRSLRTKEEQPVSQAERCHGAQPRLTLCTYEEESGDQDLEVLSLLHPGWSAMICDFFLSKVSWSGGFWDIVSSHS